MSAYLSLAAAEAANPEAVAAARSRAGDAKARAMRDPDTGKAFYLYCSYERFLEHLEQVEKEKGIVWK